MREKLQPQIHKLFINQPDIIDRIKTIDMKVEYTIYAIRKNYYSKKLRCLNELGSRLLRQMLAYIKEFFYHCFSVCC